MIYVLGVDPGAISGWALLAGGLDHKLSLLGYGHTGQRPDHLTDGRQIRVVLTEAGKLLKGSWPPTLAVEELFLPDAPHHGKQRAMAVSTLKTQLVAGRWVGIAEAYGCPIYEHTKGTAGIPPAVWRGAEWGRSRWRTDQAKKYAVEAVKLIWGIDIPETHHHTAEAVFIGSYCATQIRNKKRMERIGRQAR